MSAQGKDSDHLSIISCRQCRQRKIKCGRQFPGCDNCVKRSYECNYPDTHRKTSTKLVKSRKHANARYYGFSSVNRSLFEAGMPFCNVDFELEGKYASSSMKRFINSKVYKKYIEEPSFILQAMKLVKNSASYSFFEHIVDVNALETNLKLKKGCGFQTLLLLYAVTILSERFFDSPPDVQDLIEELHLLLDDCPDCPEKVSSYILLADYYHCNFKIEAAWKRIYLATSIGYALGLHSTSSKIWAMLMFEDSLLCSILGRPSSISKINPKLIHNLCDGWGEIALFLREFNAVLLDLESEHSIEKVICLELKCDTIIEKTRSSLNDRHTQYDQKLKFLDYLKLLIMVSSQVRLLFPLFSKHRLIKRRLDENCSGLANLLCELFEYLTNSGLATRNNFFNIRSHFFPAYCCVFQAFLFQFLFTSSELVKVSDKEEACAGQVSIPRDLTNVNSAVSSLSNTVTLLKNFDYVADKINFCGFMRDVFESFRALLCRKTDEKLLAPLPHIYPPGLPTYDKPPPLCGDVSSESQEVTSPFTEDIADWITSCFYDGVPYLLSGDKPYQ